MQIPKGPTLLILLLAMTAGIFISIHTDAQNTAPTIRGGKWGLEVDYIGGKIFKHSRKINHVPTDATQGFQIDYYMKTLGEKPWHKPLNFPEVGASLLYLRFGESKTFGDAIALMAYARFYVYRSKFVNLYVRVGSGYGYITRKFDYLTNPTNNVISTNINMAVQLKMGMEWKLSPNVQLNTAFAFDHFSNSGANLPNYGANLLLGSIGIKVIPRLRELTYNCQKTTDFKKNEFIWKYSLGIQEVYGFNGPKYPIHSGTVAYARYTSPGNKIYAGLTFEYLRSVHDWVVYNELTTKHGATFEASIGSVIIGDEIILGRIGMFYSAGVYLWKNTAAYSPMYFKLGANVYFAQFGKGKRFKFFVGNNVKSHLSVAQCNEFSIGGTL